MLIPNQPVGWKAFISSGDTDIDLIEASGIWLLDFTTNLTTHGNLSILHSDLSISKNDTTRKTYDPTETPIRRTDSQDQSKVNLFYHGRAPRTRKDHTRVKTGGGRVRVNTMKRTELGKVKVTKQAHRSILKGSDEEMLKKPNSGVSEVDLNLAIYGPWLLRMKEIMMQEGMAAGQELTYDMVAEKLDGSELQPFQLEDLDEA
ncbi:hypothetical protein J3R30DRAFT_3686620 [Lentinula aciculospora]|uniref:Uncharacterized protein n=1 Tax=Lentinula aciculospora TaxID=153920 RepID=A0A9W8ZZL8_9AGAR|nr:hypothetical protein J3R30DRAFT_3686620 [Lentinula aciculospora]